MSSSMILRTDGGSRGNPGPAGFGAALFSEDDQPIGLYVGFLGIATNNVAEYRGVIAGLEAALKNGNTHLKVELDSKLIVQQLTGAWKVKHEAIKPLASYAAQLVSQFASISFQWVPREKNKVADKLANLAMDNPVEYQVELNDFASYHTVSGSLSAGISDESTDSMRLDQTISSVSQSQNTGYAPEVWGKLPSGSTRILLLRHGQIPLSIERRLVGCTDQSLTELGRQHIVQAAQYIANVNVESAPQTRISAVYASPLKRCQESAAIVAERLNLPVATDERLRETHFGKWEGMSIDEVKTQHPELYFAWMRDTAMAPPQGESINATYSRVSDFIATMVTEHPNSTILLCSHVGPIKAAMGLSLGVGPTFAMRSFLELASLSVIDMKPGGKGSLRSMNETAYLHC